MNKHLFSILVLTAVMLPLAGCSGEEAAPQKAAVDVKAAVNVKAAKPAATQNAAQNAAAKAAASAPKSPDAQKSAPAEQKNANPATAAKTPVPAAPKPAGAAQTAAADVTPDDLPPPLAVPQGYHYQPRGRRDPFVNPIPKPVTAENVPLARPDGLPGVLVNELRVSGIVYAEDPSMKKAILTAGRKTYFAKQGDRLFDAVIKEIRPSEVVFTMISTATKKPLNRETVVGTGSPTSARR